VRAGDEVLPARVGLVDEFAIWSCARTKLPSSALQTKSTIPAFPETLRVTKIVIAVPSLAALNLRSSLSKLISLIALRSVPLYSTPMLESTALPTRWRSASGSDSRARRGEDGLSRLGLAGGNRADGGFAVQDNGDLLDFGQFLLVDLELDQAVTDAGELRIGNSLIFCLNKCRSCPRWP
jgi:hypothetical protein